MIYGTVEFEVLGHPVAAELTGCGWRVTGPKAIREQPIEAILDILVSPDDFGDGDGDPSAACLAKLASLLKGTYSLASTPISIPATVD